MPEPDHFYHYASIANEERKGWLRDILVNKQIYFRSREQLNDPEEMRPQIRFDGTEKELRDFAKDMFRRYGPKLSPTNYFREVKKYTHSLRHSPELYEEISHMILDKLGILSLSEAPDIPPLWAHYADRSRGVCFEFDSNLGLFAVAHKILYDDEPPTINRLSTSTRELLDKSILTKRAAWEYEQEWRVVARWDDPRRKLIYLEEHNVPETAKPFIRAQDGPGHYEFPREALTSVILGSEITPEDEEFVQEVVDCLDYEVPIRRARFVPGRGIEIV